MLKRILIIALLTGAGQLYSIFVLKIISGVGGGQASFEIAQLDTLFFFMISVIAFGLQPAAIRNLALAKEWKSEFKRVQAARITLGLILTLLVIAAFFYKYYLIFLLAPIIAASGEYALYARGAAIYGSLISFLRLSIPFTAVLVAAYFVPSYTGVIYVVSLIFIHFITIFLIAWRLQVQPFSKPSLQSLKLYVSSIPLGIVTLSQYMIGLGLLLVAPYFYKSEGLGIIFAGLKFYVLYKGVLRIIHQAFIQDMTNPAIGVKVDQLSIMLAFLFLLSVFFFPDSFITFFFGQQALSQKVFFQLLGVAAVFYTVFLSMATSILLQKMDYQYSMITAIAALLSVASCIILSFSLPSGISIGISLCVGEFAWLCGLIWMATKENRVEKRLLFFGEISFLFAVPLVITYWFGDKLLNYMASFAVVSILLLFLHHRKFRI